MSTEEKPAQPIGPPRRGRVLGKRSRDGYICTRPYIRRDLLRQVRIELERRKQLQLPMTDFSELVEALLIDWLREHLNKDEIDELLSYEEPARKGAEK